ncbi:hypothetical protein SPRG_18195 [Saprolegnia parasitica CBS 223.65]|uniref:Uncharacterized protein n=1 Tax=Saprolegnia parasitica (strain CBS 223.65) TaxID=695850 RepID=A0A067BHR8_SAPPC|nr:hypothetical protein SPRG_18195 [Saprolegnia parasitica CBS 223.65]KDO16270.1 hypothetical protein SPRG_18195 [Saprolegnia parasitica CBS 223.65]|eukprot:XP_012213021.1 hypothetical protein SPRG_18195 [Saprolegnia parasitica CBS 223.65]
MKTTRSTPQFSLSLPNLTFRSMPKPAGYRITLTKTETKGAFELSLESLRSMKQWTCAIANTQSVCGDETQLPSAMLFDLLRTALEGRNEQLKLLATLGDRLSELFGDVVMRGTAMDVDLVPSDSGAVVLTLTIPLLPVWSTTARFRCEEKPFDSLNAVRRKVEHLEEDVEILATKVDMHISIIVLAILLVVGAAVSLSVTKLYYW